MAGIGVGIDLSTVSAALRKTDKAFASSVKRELRKAVTEEGAVLLAEIKASASWSTRIPGATSIAVTLGTKSANVRIKVDKKKAPHARGYEMGSANNTIFRESDITRALANGAKNRREAIKQSRRLSSSFATKALRHPVFGHGDKATWTWTLEPARPFFFTTIGKRDPATTKRFNEVLDRVIADAIKGRE